MKQDKNITALLKENRVDIEKNNIKGNNILE